MVIKMNPLTGNVISTVPATTFIHGHLGTLVQNRAFDSALDEMAGRHTAIGMEANSKPFGFHASEITSTVRDIAPLFKYVDTTGPATAHSMGGLSILLLLAESRQFFKPSSVTLVASPVSLPTLQAFDFSFRALMGRVSSEKVDSLLYQYRGAPSVCSAYRSNLSSNAAAEGDSPQTCPLEAISGLSAVKSVHAGHRDALVPTRGSNLPLGMHLSAPAPYTLSWFNPRTLSWVHGLPQARDSFLSFAQMEDAGVVGGHVDAVGSASVSAILGWMAMEDFKNISARNGRALRDDELTESEEGSEVFKGTKEQPDLWMETEEQNRSRVFKLPPPYMAVGPLGRRDWVRGIIGARAVRGPGDRLEGKGWPEGLTGGSGEVVVVEAGAVKPLREGSRYSSDAEAKHFDAGPMTKWGLSRLWEGWSQFAPSPKVADPDNRAGDIEGPGNADVSGRLMWTTKVSLGDDGLEVERKRKSAISISSTGPASRLVQGSEFMVELEDVLGELLTGDGVGPDEEEAFSFSSILNLSGDNTRTARRLAVDAAMNLQLVCSRNPSVEAALNTTWFYPREELVELNEREEALVEELEAGALDSRPNTSIMKESTKLTEPELVEAIRSHGLEWLAAKVKSASGRGRHLQGEPHKVAPEFPQTHLEHLEHRTKGLPPLMVDAEVIACPPPPPLVDDERRAPPFEWCSEGGPNSPPQRVSYLAVTQTFYNPVPICQYRLPRDFLKTLRALKRDGVDVSHLFIRIRVRRFVPESITYDQNLSLFNQGGDISLWGEGWFGSAWMRTVNITRVIDPSTVGDGDVSNPTLQQAEQWRFQEVHTPGPTLRRNHQPVPLERAFKASAQSSFPFRPMSLLQLLTTTPLVITEKDLLSYARPNVLGGLSIPLPHISPELLTDITLNLRVSRPRADTKKTHMDRRPVYFALLSPLPCTAPGQPCVLAWGSTNQERPDMWMLGGDDRATLQSDAALPTKTAFPFPPIGGVPELVLYGPQDVLFSLRKDNATLWEEADSTVLEDATAADLIYGPEDALQWYHFPLEVRVGVNWLATIKKQRHEIPALIVMGVALGILFRLVPATLRLLHPGKLLKPTPKRAPADLPADLDPLDVRSYIVRVWSERRRESSSGAVRRSLLSRFLYDNPWQEGSVWGLESGVEAYIGCVVLGIAFASGVLTWFSFGLNVLEGWIFGSADYVDASLFAPVPFFVNGWLLSVFMKGWFTGTLLVAFMHVGLLIHSLASLVTKLVLRRARTWGGAFFPLRQHFPRMRRRLLPVNKATVGIFILSLGWCPFASLVVFSCWLPGLAVHVHTKRMMAYLTNRRATVVAPAPARRSALAYQPVDDASSSSGRGTDVEQGEQDLHARQPVVSEADLLVEPGTEEVTAERVANPKEMFTRIQEGVLDRLIFGAGPAAPPPSGAIRRVDKERFEWEWRESNHEEVRRLFTVLTAVLFAGVVIKLSACIAMLFSSTWELYEHRDVHSRQIHDPDPYPGLKPLAILKELFRSSFVESLPYIFYKSTSDPRAWEHTLDGSWTLLPSYKVELTYSAYSILTSFALCWSTLQLALLSLHAMELRPSGLLNCPPPCTATASQCALETLKRTYAIILGVSGLCLFSMGSALWRLPLALSCSCAGIALFLRYSLVSLGLPATVDQAIACGRTKKVTATPSSATPTQYIAESPVIMGARRPTSPLTPPVVPV